MALINSIPIKNNKYDILGCARREDKQQDRVEFWVAYRNNFTHQDAYFMQVFSMEAILSMHKTVYLQELLVKAAANLAGNELAIAVEKYFVWAGSKWDNIPFSVDTSYESDGPYQHSKTTINSELTKYLSGGYVDYKFQSHNQHVHVNPAELYTNGGYLGIEYPKDYEKITFEEFKKAADTLKGKSSSSGGGPSMTAVGFLPGVDAKVKHPPLREDDSDPKCGWDKNAAAQTLKDMIIHLNDTHKWKREDIADWLDTLDIDLRFKSSEQLAEEKKQKQLAAAKKNMVDWQSKVEATTALLNTYKLAAEDAAKAFKTLQEALNVED